MQIYSLWATRKSGLGDPPELLCAWDDFSVADNPEGWEDDCRRSLQAVASDLDLARTIVLEVSLEAIQAAFRPAEVPTEVNVSEPTSPPADESPD